MSIAVQFQFDENHETRANEIIVPESAYIMSYDTKALRISDYHHFTEEVPLTIFKAVLLNTLDQFVAEYCESLWQIATACEEIKKRGPSINEKIVIDYQTAMQLIGRSQARLDQAITDIARWDGSTPICTMLPYTELAFQEFKPGDIIGQKQKLDTGNCKPMVNGMLFTAEWKTNADGMLRAPETGNLSSLVAKQKKT